MRITSILTDASVLAEIGQRLRRARVERGLTQADLAAAVGLSRLTIMGIENGRPVDLLSFVRILRGVDLLTVLEALLPTSVIGPVEMRDTTSIGRRRVRKQNSLSSAGPWKWGDER